MNLEALLQSTIERNASDLHLKVGRPPLFRISGELLPDEESTPVTQMDIEDAFFDLMGEHLVERFHKEMEADFGYDFGDGARFRINLFFQRGRIGAVLRRIPLSIPTMDDLGLPPVLKELALRKQGCVLVAGPTGSGKSTTMASMVEYINSNRACHIVSIEDPIEFVYTDRKATINQRQLGTDTLAMEEALKRVLRQDPDVILMGEMRDAKSMEIAMHAAETGHLVFATIHTQDSAQTLDRVMNSFPADMGQQIRQLFSQTMLGIVAQKLIRRRDGAGLACAVEVLVNSPHVSQLLADGKMGEIEDALQKGGEYYQMQSFNQCLARLVVEGIITPEDGLANSPRPGDLKLLLRGIGSGSSGIRRVQSSAACAAPEPESPHGPERRISMRSATGLTRRDTPGAPANAGGNAGAPAAPAAPGSTGNTGGNGQGRPRQ